MLLLVGSQRKKPSVMADQKQCPRLAEGPLLVSSVTLPWVVNLVSPNKPDTALHPQTLAGSLQGRGSSGGVSPENTASCSNTPAARISAHVLPSLERTAVVHGCLEPHLQPSWASKGSAIRDFICRGKTWFSELPRHYKPEGHHRTVRQLAASHLGVR